MMSPIKPWRTYSFLKNTSADVCSPIGGSPSTPNSRYRWILLASLWTVYASFGLILGALPPLVVYLSTDLELSRSAMGSILGAWPLVYIAAAIPAGVLIDRFGLRFCLTLGAALMALSGMLRALASDHLSLYLAVAVFGLGGPFISIGAPKLISSWFGDKKRGLAMGIYLTAPSIGGMVALATANSLLMPLYDNNWRLVLVTYAGIAVLAGIVWWIVARNAGSSVDTASVSSPGSLTGLKVYGQLLQLPLVRMVLILSFGSFLFGHGLGNWLPEILRVGGMSVRKAGFWAMMPSAVGLVTTMVVPRIAVRKRRIPILVVTLLSASVSTIIISTLTGPVLIFGLLLVGIANRGVMPILMLTLMDSPKIGPSRMGAAGGLFFTVGEVGGVLGPLLLGVLSDATGSFSGGLYSLAGTCAILAFLAIRLRSVS